MRYLEEKKKKRIVESLRVNRLKKNFGIVEIPLSHALAISVPKRASKMT